MSLEELHVNHKEIDGTLAHAQAAEWIIEIVMRSDEAQMYSMDYGPSSSIPSVGPAEVPDRVMRRRERRAEATQKSR